MIRLGQVEPVRKRIAEATTTLLGDTIVLSDADWIDASRLPGWSRAQVATHIARSADAMRRVTLSAIEGRQQPLYRSSEERRSELERGANRAGLDLQIDLDTTAGALDEAFGLVSDWSVPVRLPAGTLPLSAVVIARLHEVVLHHLDLRTAFSFDKIDAVTASWLLQWAAIWLDTKSGLPTVRLESASGIVEELGHGAVRRTVSGTDAALWAWITGRDPGASLTGADGIAWPLLG